jgi:hypothetical protein
MGLLQPKLGSKVKLKLTQPNIMCGGRDKVSCYYKGIVTKEDNLTLIWIEFKYKGELINEPYNVITNSFKRSDLKDIKIK